MVQGRPWGYFLECFGHHSGDIWGAILALFGALLTHSSMSFRYWPLPGSFDDFLNMCVVSSHFVLFRCSLMLLVHDSLQGSFG